MKLNYTMKSNGMYILSVRDFDDIATLVLTEYQPNALEWPQPVNIDYLATECLYLDIKHEHISINGSILGMIAFSDTEIPGLDILYRPTVFQLSEGTMLIDSSLIGYEQRPRARFTKAHEVGHWICHRSYHSPDNRQLSSAEPEVMLSWPVGQTVSSGTNTRNRKPMRTGKSGRQIILQPLS